MSGREASNKIIISGRSWNDSIFSHKKYYLEAFIYSIKWKVGK